MIFSDFAGFSKLSDAALPVFWEKVMGKAGEVFRRHARDITAVNGWGDALFVDVQQAAGAIALDLKREIAAVVTEGASFAPGSGMRFALHYGPVHSRRSDHRAPQRLRHRSDADRADRAGDRSARFSRPSNSPRCSR